MTAITCSAAVGWRSTLKRPSYIYAVVHNTTGFNIKELYLLSTDCMSFVWLTEQTDIIFLYGIKLLVVRKGVYLLRGTSSILRPRRQPGSIPSMSMGYCGGQSNTYLFSVHKTHLFLEKCDLNPTCILCAEGSLCTISKLKHNE